MNALRHGLTARHVVLKDEREKEFLNLVAAYQAALEPRGEIETALVADMAVARWRLQRIWGMETAALADKMEEQDRRPERDFKTAPETLTRAARAFFKLTEIDTSMALLSRYEARCLRTFDHALARLQRLQADRKAKDPVRRPHPAEDCATRNAFLQNEPEKSLK